jgi:glucose-6-phosphate 1-dehydrogenase
VDEVSDAWAGAGYRPAPYKPGSWGPDEADLLMSRTGRAWNSGDA